MDQGAKYDDYLERLTTDAQSLGSDFQNFTELWQRLDDYSDEINEAPGTFTSILGSLRTSTVVLSHRLFDSSSVSLHELIRIAQTHRDTIAWERGAPTDDELQAQLDRIDGLSDVLDRLRINRNKVYAHLDKKHVLSRKAFAQDFPLAEDDVRAVIELAHSILEEHHLWRFNVTLSMVVANSVNVDHLLHLIRVGRKYRQQDMIGEARARRERGAV